MKIAVGALLMTSHFTIAQADNAAIEADRVKPVIKSVIHTVIIPAYKQLTLASTEQLAAMQQLCENPNPQSDSNAKEKFGLLVASWSRAEMYRFGPSRTANRQEKLFFWPDRRSRGIKQVRKILDTKDESALSLTNLRQKSVAVQGLTALEYVLFGKGAENIVSEQGASFRCQYGVTVAQAIFDTSTNILKDWQKTDGFAHTLTSAGKKNPVFQSNKEVIRDFLQWADELILSLMAQKLNPALKTSMDTARPKLAPFWRSNLTLLSFDANLASLLELQQNTEFLNLLAEDENGFHFEISQSRKILQFLMSRNEPWATIVGTTDTYEKLLYLRNPLGSAHEILSEHYPEALGITMGFNSLDGD